MQPANEAVPACRLLALGNDEFAMLPAKLQWRLAAYYRAVRAFDLAALVLDAAERRGLVLRPVWHGAPSVRKPPDETTCIAEAFVAVPATVSIDLVDATFVRSLRYGYVHGVEEQVLPSLARFELRGIDPMPAGMPKIEVTFLLDADGVLQVAARELRTGKAASIEVKPTYGLAEGDVARMVEESFTYAEADVATHLLVEARNEADTVLTHVGRALRQAGTLVTAEERQEIETAAAALRAARGGDDRDVIHERTAALNRATEGLAERMMDAALRGALDSRRADELLESPRDGAGGSR